MDLGIAGKTALVLGAGGGLGSAIARAMAREGANVALGDINLEAAQAAVATIRANGGDAEAIAWDLAEISSIDTNIRKVEGRFGSVDILVNLTGGPPPGSIMGQDPETWRKYFESMVLPIFAVADRVIPTMQDKKWGRIVTSTSSGVVSPISNLGLSNSLRLSLVGWSKTLAKEVGRDGITTNIVVPGRIATQRITFLDQQKAQRERKSVEEVRAESVESIPVGRYGDPDEYADAVAFLVSSRAAYITGSVVRVDGGLIAGI